MQPWHEFSADQRKSQRSGSRLPQDGHEPSKSGGCLPSRIELVRRHAIIRVPSLTKSLGASSKILASMEAIKMTGSTTISSDTIEALRETEIRAGKSFRWLEALTATSGMSL